MSLRTGLFRRQVLVDSSAFLALAERRETDHREAQAIAARLQAAKWELVTTNYLLAEAHALLLSRLGVQFATRFLHQIRASGTSGATRIIRATPEDEDRAVAIITTYQDKDFSFTDAVSFAVMERLGIRYAFTFDHHFAQYGITALVAGQF